MQPRWYFILLITFSTAIPIYHNNCRTIEDCFTALDYELEEYAMAKRSELWSSGKHKNVNLHSNINHVPDITKQRTMTPVHRSPFFVNFGR